MKDPNYYSFGDTTTDMPSNVHYQLHTHDDYEILLFMEGDARYVVEEKTYTLEPCDIIIIRKSEETYWMYLVPSHAGEILRVIHRE